MQIIEQSSCNAKHPIYKHIIAPREIYIYLYKMSFKPLIVLVAVGVAACLARPQEVISVAVVTDQPIDAGEVKIQSDHDAPAVTESTVDVVAISAAPEQAATGTADIAPVSQDAAGGAEPPSTTEKAVEGNT